MSTNTCGVVIAGNYSDIQPLGALSQLQNICNTEQLPIALIFVIDFQMESKESEDLLNSLVALEHQISGCNIPLILLIGDYQAKIDAAINAYRPKYVFYSKDFSSVEPASLKVHRYTWPSKVMTVQDLIPIVYKKQNSC